MFVWVFHRISGLLLIVLLTVQLFTGFYQASGASTEQVRTIAGLHKHTILNCLTVFLVIFHALYGIRTILMDLGLKRERLLFWLSTGTGCVLFVVFLVLFWRFVA